MQGNSVIARYYSDICRFSFHSTPFSVLLMSKKSKLSLWDRKVYGSYLTTPLKYAQARSLVQFRVHATSAETDQPKWWEKHAGPNMIDIHSTQEFLDAMSQAGDRLVIVEFYSTWCASCRALFPKLCKIAEEHPEILFLKVNFDENKSMCKSLDVKVLPFFHVYRGADRLLESFSCSLAKIQKLKDAITNHTSTHNTGSCSQSSLKGSIDGSLNLPSQPS